MTREEIVALEPGRILDFYVAEKVMGWIKNDLGYDIWWNGITYTPTINPYSTDISAAWEVVNKLDDGRHEIEMLKAPYYDDVWIVKIAEFEDVCDENGMYRTFEVQAESKSLPEAITKASLLAVLEATP